MKDKPVLKSKWREGSLVWEVFDITVQGEEYYYHLKLIRGNGCPDNRVGMWTRPRVVDLLWFDKKRRATNKMWAGTPALSCDPVLICAANQPEAIKLLKNTLFQTEAKYFRGMFVRCTGTIERVACKNLTETGVWTVERNREYGLPKTASEYIPAKIYK